MADDLDKVALDVVAHGIVGHVWEQVRQNGSVQMDRADYQGLSDEQWIDVMRRADRLLDALAPSRHEFSAAYERLTGEAG